MSRFNCPEEFSDQKIIWNQLMSAGDTLSGMGEYGMANDIWAVAAQVRAEVVFHRRYVKDNTEEDQRRAEALAEYQKTSNELHATAQALMRPDDMDMRVCLTHARINVCRPGMREERETGEAACRWSTQFEDYARLAGATVRDVQARLNLLDEMTDG